MPTNGNGKSISGKWPNILFVLAAFIVVTPFFNYVLMTKSISAGSEYRTGSDQLLIAKNAELEARIREMEALVQSSHEDEHARPPSLGYNGDPSVSSSLRVKAGSINSYWWPSAENMGGLLGKIYATQNPLDCSSPSTKFFVWRSRPGTENERDTRGLTAWAHAGASHMLHAFTDGDGFPKHSSRVLMTDEKLWPMAKGCLKGPETRECYFEPLSKCSMSDVDKTGSRNATVLVDYKEEYNRSQRTLYTSNKRWFRLVNQKYSWTELPGDAKDHSDMAMVAASLVYYFRPKVRRPIQACLCNLQCLNYCILVCFYSISNTHLISHGFVTKLINEYVNPSL